MPSYLEESIASRSVTNLRGVLKGAISADPAFIKGNFDAAVRQIETKAPGLIDKVYEPNDAVKYPLKAESQWSKEYFYEVLTCLSYNFSRERVAHLRKIGAKVMRDDKIYAPTTPSGTTTVKRMDGTTAASKTPENAAKKERQSPTAAQEQQRRIRKTLLLAGLAIIAVAVLAVSVYAATRQPVNPSNPL